MYSCTVVIAFPVSTESPIEHIVIDIYRLLLPMSRRDMDDHNNITIMVKNLDVILF